MFSFAKKTTFHLKMYDRNDGGRRPPRTKIFFELLKIETKCNKKLFSNCFCDVKFEPQKETLTWNNKNRTHNKQNFKNNFFQGYLIHQQPDLNDSFFEICYDFVLYCPKRFNLKGSNFLPVVLFN